MFVSMRRSAASSRTRSLGSLVLVAFWAFGTAAPAGAAARQPTYFTDLPSVTGNSVCGGVDVGVTGLYQDGLGTYPGSQGQVLHPACPTRRSSGRAVNLLLPAGTLNDPIATCGAIWLSLPDFLNAQVGDVLGVAAPPNSSTGETVFLYFLTDSNGDGKFTSPGDNQYNIRWQGGIYVVSRTDTGNTTTFVLSTKHSNPDLDLSGAAELIHRNDPLYGQISKGSYCIPLELTITVSR